MDINNAASSRALYYDRNASNVQIGAFAYNVAPHGTTVNGTYTCPANRKAIITLIEVEISRQTAAAPANQIREWLTLTPFGEAAQTLFRLHLYKNAVGDRAAMGVSPGVVMYPGDVLSSYSSDNSTGGTSTIIAVAQITEFDF